MTERNRIQLIYEDEIAAGEVVEEIIIPADEVWQITRITFGDMSKNDSKSGVFKVDFGDPIVRDIIAIAYLSGNTLPLSINRTFVGDGIKALRLIRTNQSNPAKMMLIFIEGFKRTGE